MPTLPLFRTASRQSPLFQNPILFVSIPPTNRSEATHSPPSLLLDRRRPFTTRSTDVPPPPATSSLAPGLVVPTPTLPPQPTNTCVMPSAFTLCVLMCRPLPVWRR